MKKKMLATTLLTGLLAACSGNSASVTGVWIEPIPGMEDQVQGIKLEEGGIASSVNMATLVYKNWKQEGDQLILAGNSYIGNTHQNRIHPCFLPGTKHSDHRTKHCNKCNQQ